MTSARPPARSIACQPGAWSLPASMVVKRPPVVTPAAEVATSFEDYDFRTGDKVLGTIAAVAFLALWVV